MADSGNGHALDPGLVARIGGVVEAGSEFIASLEGFLVTQGVTIRPFEEVRLAKAGFSLHAALLLALELSDGLPCRVRNDLRLLERGFNDPCRAWNTWGWEQVLAADGSEFIDEQERRYRRDVFDPLLGAAASRARDRLVDDWELSWATQAEADRVQPTLTLEEAERRWPELGDRYFKVPVIGTIRPVCDGIDLDAVHRPVERLRGWLDWQRQRDGGGAPETAAASSPLGELPDAAPLGPADPGSKAPVLAVVADPYDDLVGEMRRNRAKVRPAFLEYMKTRRRAKVEDIAQYAHGNDQTSDEAIRTNVKRVNEDLAGKAIPIRFVVGSGYVHKEDPPA